MPVCSMPMPGCNADQAHAAHLAHNASSLNYLRASSRSPSSTYSDLSSFMEGLRLEARKLFQERFLSFALHLNTDFGIILTVNSLLMILSITALPTERQGCFFNHNKTKDVSTMALNNKQMLVVSIGIALQAAIMVLLNPYVGKACNGMALMWVAFQAWAMYFMAGCTPKDGLKVLIGYLTGIIASMAIVKLMGVPGIKDLPMIGDMNLVMAVAVFIIVIPAIMSENLKNFVPALFIGSGAFFAILGSKDLDVAGNALNSRLLFAMQAEIIYCIFGLVFGWITVTARGKYEASLAK